MAVNEDNVSRILVVLSHPLRREILSNLSEKGECSFTDLMNALHVDTGKLSFHIRSLEGFLEQAPTGKYRLTKTGENAIRLLGDLKAWAVEVDVAKIGSSLPLATFKRRVSAFLIDFAIALAVFAAYLALPYAFSLVTRGPTYFLDPSVILFSLVLFWIYFTLLEGFVGQSLGKRITGLMVVRIDGKKLFYDAAAVRNFGKVFLLPFDLIFGYRLKDSRFIRYFDKFAGTTVKDLRRQL
jgi:uncharacterized RDD family membrane protein YckC/DNA-binding transcriptional ArsR family regulator